MTFLHSRRRVLVPDRIMEIGRVLFNEWLMTVDVEVTTGQGLAFLKRRSGKQCTPTVIDGTQASALSQLPLQFLSSTFH